MIIDFKYHVASIVAVFLALGIGILVGSSLVGSNVNDVIVQQQNKIYENLKQDLSRMKTNARQVQNELQVYKESVNIDSEFEKSVLPVLISNRLVGKKIAIVETNYSSLHGEWIETLRKAGAEITSITTILNGYRLDDPAVREAVATKLMINTSKKETVAPEVASEIAGGIINAQNLENLHYFEQQGMIKVSGKYGVPLDCVVLAGGGNDKQQFANCQNIDLPITKEFQKNKIQVLGVENSDVTYSYMEQYQKLKIDTIDNVDKVPGQLSLIMTVSGQNGNYGIKPTAERLIPVLQYTNR